MSTKYCTVSNRSLRAVVILGLIFSSAASSQSLTLVQSVQNSLWNPPSPDSSGIVYIDSLDRLFVADSEVNETPLFTGDNIFEITSNGVLQQTFSSISYTGEPTGIAYNPSNHHLFISEDNSPRRIYEIDPGSDGIFDTPDDSVTSFSTTDFGSSDAEGLTYNTAQGTLHIVDGINSEVYTVHPGANGVFDGVAPVGDDIVTNFDTAGLGINDPEGIAYDSDFGHLYIVGKPRNDVAHVTTGGVLLRILDISAASPYKPAGLAYAPSSQVVGENNLYIVDRGVDNNSNASENDGELYEFSLPLLPGNLVPTVSITAPANNAIFFLGQEIVFSGQADDPEDGNLSTEILWTSSVDGALGQGSPLQLPASSLQVGAHVITASVTDNSSATSSDIIVIEVTETANVPPIVSITSPVDNSTFVESQGISFIGSAIDQEDGDLSASLLWTSDLDGQLGTGTVITNLSKGNHQITASVSDSNGLVGSQVVSVTVNPDTNDNIILEVRVDSGNDDAEEKPSGSVSLTSSDLELVFDYGDQIVGMRFNNVLVPPGAGIVDARIQFQTDETSGNSTNLSIQGEATDQALTFVKASNNISSRNTTMASVDWEPAAWGIVGESGPKQLTPNLQLLVQEIVTRPGWSSGNSMAFIVRGTGERVAESYNGSAGAAALLKIVYSSINSPPAVDAGANQTISINEVLLLQGDASDPDTPGAVTVTWSQESGPGVASFALPNSLETEVSFSEVGNYVLQLTADDGELMAIDQIQVTVEASVGNIPPFTDAGPNLEMTIDQDPIFLEGIVTDDGLPAAPGVVSIIWSKISGPGDVIFNPEDAASTLASFSTIGNYVLELAAYDGELLASDLVDVTVLDSSGTATFQARVAGSADDAEEKSNSKVSLNSSDLELIYDKSDQTIGMRFNNVTIPAGANILSAHIQFTVDEVSLEGPIALIIQGEKSSNALPFVATNGNISSRTRTDSFTNWSPPPWEEKRDSGVAQRSEDISNILEEILAEPGWSNGNSVAIIITGTGKRVAESYDGSATQAPLLEVQYQVLP